MVFTLVLKLYLLVLELYLLILEMCLLVVDVYCPCQGGRSQEIREVQNGMQSYAAL